MALHILLLLIIHQVVSESLQPHEVQYSRIPCPSPPPWVCSDSWLLSQWCYPTISSPVAHFYSCPQSFPESVSFPMIWLFTSGGKSIRASASAPVLPVNIYDWFPLSNGLISLQTKALPRVFSNTTVQKHQFFDTLPSIWSTSHIHIWLLEKPLTGGEKMVQ